MHLVDAERSAYLYDRMPADKRQISGGSAANTAAGVARFGGRAAFVGKVAADPLGDVFADDLHELGVHYRRQPAARRPGDGALDDPGVARRRADDEHLSRRLPAADRRPTSRKKRSAAAAVTYMEGYLWDPAEAKKAFVTAAHFAHKHERADGVHAQSTRSASTATATSSST